MGYWSESGVSSFPQVRDINFILDTANGARFCVFGV